MLVPHADLPENNHQPMEVAAAQPETANAVESQPVIDPPQTRFTWRIENFTRLNTKKLYSEVFVVGAYKWRVLFSKRKQCGLFVHVSGCRRCT
jgi:ubiquitin carboxyl-terminal hydrolase 7